MSFADECRHWTTPRWLSCIYERLLQPFSVTISGSLPISGDIAVSNFPNYKIPPYTRRTFVTTDGSITQINYFDGATQGLTTTRASNLDNLDAAVSSRSTLTKSDVQGAVIPLL